MKKNKNLEQKSKNNNDIKLVCPKCKSDDYDSVGKHYRCNKCNERWEQTVFIKDYNMEKLKKLKIEWSALMEEYRKNYPNGNDGSISCDLLLDKIKDIEITFRTLGIRIQDLEI